MLIGTMLVGASAADSFTDTTTHWAKKYIEYCVSEGVVNGRGNGAFDPDGNVTGSEAAKTMLTAMGWDAEIEGYVNTKDRQKNVDSQANRDGLSGGPEGINTSKELIRDEAAQMV